MREVYIIDAVRTACGKIGGTLKKIATGVIGRNEEDAVANYIRDRIK